MTKFADQLFDDLIREHGSTLTNARPPAPRRHIGTRRALLAVGGGGVAVAAAAGVLVATAGTHAPGHHSADVAGGSAPSYALTPHPNGTITLAVYQKSGVAAANAKLHELGDGQVYVIPVGAGCPSLSSLPAPAVPLNGKQLSVQASSSTARNGSVTVNAKGIPAGDILVVAVETIWNGRTTTSLGANKLTSAPAPNCVSLPGASLPPALPGSPANQVHGGPGPSPSATGEPSER
jgi:hypothetical protein